MRRSTWLLGALALVLGCADPAGAPQLDEKNTKTTATGLKMEDLHVGDGAEAKTGSVVRVNYTGWLTDGKKFDSSVGREPFTVVVGISPVIKGWHEGLVGMKVGGKRRLQIPPALAYGAQGRPGIPPNATLVFDLDLVEVKPGVKIEDLKEGTGSGAKAGDAVLVHYTGKLTNGKKFDSSLDRGEPFPVLLGAGKVIPGWEAGLIGIKAGGKRKLTVPPGMAYGDEGYGADIPPKATLVFEVEALKVGAPAEIFGQPGTPRRPGQGRSPK